MNSIMVWTPSDIAGLVIVGAIIGAALINAWLMQFSGSGNDKAGRMR